MKSYKKYLLVAILIVLSSSLFAGLPHTIYVEVSIDSQNNHPESVIFNARIVGRESEILTETSCGCGYIAEDGLLFVQLGSFPAMWSAGEVLHIEVNNPSGGHGEFTLTNNGGDFFGPSHFGSDGIILFYASINGFNVDKTIVSQNSKIHFTASQIENVINWNWDFNNDGKIDSTKENPTYKYEKSGKYTVKLSITYKDGKTKSFIKKGYITVTK